MFEVYIAMSGGESHFVRRVDTESQLAGYLEQIPDLIAQTEASILSVTIKTTPTGDPTLPHFEKGNHGT